MGEWGKAVGRWTVMAALPAMMLACGPKESSMTVTHLRCEYLVDPLGIDAAQPMLSWELVSDERGQRQTSYQILVASSPERLARERADVWDSGRVPLDTSVQVIYQGPALTPRTTYYWQVRVGDRDERLTAWSDVATWTTGVGEAWEAPWIAARDVPMRLPVGQDYIPDPDRAGTFNGGDEPPRREAVLLRRDVELESAPVRALARVTALGFVDFKINGTKAGDLEMAPNLSDHSRRTYYDTFDVTDLLQAGDNTLAAYLGNGFFSTPGRGWASWFGVGREPVLSVEVELWMPDGSRQYLVTDETWKWSTGEIVYNDLFVGETQDLRLRQDGWLEPGFDDSGWNAVAVVDGPPGVLQANPSNPVRVWEEVHPVRVEDNRYYFEAMFTGFPRIAVSGEAGQRVSFGDHGKPRGQGAAWNPDGNSADFHFTLAGEGVEVLEPRFMVHTIGSVLSIEGIDPPPAEAVSIQRANADLRETGSFACSNPFLNRVHEATLRTHRNYTLPVPMDPCREKAGWTQDVLNMFESASYLTDMAALYRRWWQDFLDSQTPNGAAGSVAPMVWGGQEHCWNDPWWSGMIIYTPWKMYEFYGDAWLLARAYEPMKAYLGWLSSQAGDDGILRWAGASDWIEVGIDGWGPPVRTPTFLVSTCAWYHYADIVSQTADLLGYPDEAREYAELAQRIADTFNARYFDPETGLYAGATDSQTSLILPLSLGMVPEGKEALVLQRLEENILERGGHHSTGFVGTPRLLRDLPDLGLGELSYTICTQQEYPSWNTLMSEGVLKETWRGGLAQMPSLGGSIGQWFYRNLAGIRPAAPGFKEIVIKPGIFGDLTWVESHYDSIHGRIVSHWRREDGRLTMEITIPPNTTATVHVPARTADLVLESDQPVDQAEGVRFLGQENGVALFAVDSGTYRFKSVLPE